MVYYLVSLRIDIELSCLPLPNVGKDSFEFVLNILVW